jgi:hypothetical protein
MDLWPIELPTLTVTDRFGGYNLAYYNLAYYNLAYYNFVHGYQFMPYRPEAFKDPKPEQI